MRPLKSIINPTKLLLLISFLGTICQYLFIVFMARHLSADQYGNFSLGLGCFNIVAAGCIFGTDGSSRRYLHSLTSSGQNIFIQWTLHVLLKASIVLIIALLPISLLLYWMHSGGLQSFNNYHIAIGMLTAAPLFATFTLILNFLHISKKLFASHVFNSIVQYAMLLLFSFCSAYFFMQNLDNTSLIIIFTGSYLCLCVLAGVYFYYASGSINLFKLLAHKIKIYKQERIWNTFAKKSLLNGLGYNLLWLMDILIIEIIARNEDLVGFFSACTVITAFYWVITKNFLCTLKPTVSTAFQTKEGQAQLQESYNKKFKTALLLISTLSIILLFYHQTMLLAFGKAYVKATPTLLILSANCIVCFLFYAARLFLMYTGYETKVLNIYLVKILTLVLTCSVFTYYYSIEGTALADLFISSIFGTYMYYCFKKAYRFKLFVIF